MRFEIIIVSMALPIVYMLYVDKRNDVCSFLLNAGMCNVVTVNGQGHRRIFVFTEVPKLMMHRIEAHTCQ